MNHLSYPWYEVAQSPIIVFDCSSGPGPTPAASLGECTFIVAVLQKKCEIGS